MLAVWGLGRGTALERALRALTAHSQESLSCAVVPARAAHMGAARVYKNTFEEMPPLEKQSQLHSNDIRGEGSDPVRQSECNTAANRINHAAYLAQCNAESCAPIANKRCHSNCRDGQL